MSLLLITSSLLSSAGTQDLMTQEDLLQSVLGKHKALLLNGNVKKFQKLVGDSLIKEGGYYKFEDLWVGLSRRFEEHYKNHQVLYRKYVPWAGTAQEILAVINEVIDADAGLPFPLYNYECRKNQYVCALRKAKVLSVLTALLDIGPSVLCSLNSGEHKALLEECQQSFLRDIIQAKNFCRRFVERSILKSEGIPINALERYNHLYAYSHMPMLMNLNIMVRESDTGLFEIVQWMVSAMCGNSLHGLPILQKGVSEATYHAQKAHGFYECFEHDIGHGNSFATFLFMWNKTFPEEKNVGEYLFEGMWERVQEFACSGKASSKVLCSRMDSEL